MIEGLLVLGGGRVGVGFFFWEATYRFKLKLDVALDGIGSVGNRFLWGSWVGKGTSSSVSSPVELIRG